jgi:hypothetical protein
MHRVLSVVLSAVLAQAALWTFATPIAKAAPAPADPFCYEPLPDEPLPPDCRPPPPPPCTSNCTPPPPPCRREHPWGPCEEEPVPNDP